MITPPPLVPVADALADAAPGQERAQREALLARVVDALQYFEAELERADKLLAGAEAELTAAQAALAPLERDWLLGIPDDDLPPGVYRFPAGPSPRLAAARAGAESALAVRQAVKAAQQLATEQVALRRGVATTLERELAAP